MRPKGGWVGIGRRDEGGDPSSREEEREAESQDCGTERHCHHPLRLSSAGFYARIGYPDYCSGAGTRLPIARQVVSE